MNPITFEDYERALAKEKYFGRRWHYYERAIQMAQSLNPESVLEIGAYQLPLFHDSTVMDRRKNHPRTLVHDALESPWPFTDRQFNLGLALQVFEHFEGRQREAFNEMCRVCDKVILSYPWRWRSNDKSHADIDFEDLQKWTGQHFTEAQIVGPPECRRAICVFEPHMRIT
ncbi:MAG: hypothetical protein ACJASX_003558 [Limisphaerales bacterium]|jgi:hypothetical protein